MKPPNSLPNNVQQEGETTADNARPPSEKTHTLGLQELKVLFNDAMRHSPEHKRMRIEGFIDDIPLMTEEALRALPHMLHELQSTYKAELMEEQMKTVVQVSGNMINASGNQAFNFNDNGPHHH